MAKKKRKKKVEVQSKDVTFVSDYPFLKIVFKPADFENHLNGRRTKLYGKYIQFEKGFYITSNKAEIALIKSRPLYNSGKIQVFGEGAVAPVLDQVTTIPGVVGGDQKDDTVKTGAPGDSAKSVSKVKIPSKSK